MSFQKMLEYTFADIKKKQLDITDLFPTFHDRVRQVAAKGGVLLKERLPEVWHFKVASGTDDKRASAPGKPARHKYDVYVQFRNIYELIKKFVSNQELWKKDGSGVDHRKLADAIFNEVDMETSCSCPATLYWGQDYIRTQKDAQYGDREDRPPKIKNPREKGALCKHGDLVFDVLPAYKSTFAKHLMQFYEKTIKAIEDQVRDGEIPPEGEEPVKPKGPAPKEPVGKKKVTKKAPPEPDIAAKPEPKKAMEQPGGSKGATSPGATSAASSATEPNGSATKRVS
jgi:hypothetical protein